MINLNPCHIVPRSYQTGEIARIVESLRRHRVHANTSVTGSGKTILACLAARQLGRDLCVVCPKIVIDAWKATAANCGVRLHWCFNYEHILARAKRAKAGEEFSYLDCPLRWVTPSKTDRGRWFIPSGSLLVMDEAHKLSGLTSDTSKLLFAAVDQKIPVLLLSATLAETPEKLNAIGYALKLHRGGSDFDAWAMRNAMAKTPWGWKFVGGTTQMKQIRSSCGEKISGLSSDEIPDLPANVLQFLDLPTEENLDDLYLRELEELELYAEDPLTASLRARQIAELQKLPALAEHIKLAHAEGNAPVIFLNFVESGLRMEKLLGKMGAKFIYGASSQDQRRGTIEGFQKGTVTCLILQIATGGVGVSLHNENNVRPRISYICPGWSAREFIQALGRIRRVGSVDETVFQKICYAADSEIEGRIAGAIRAKTENIEALNDDDLLITKL